MSEEERQPCTSLEVENNISGVIIGVHKPCSKCLNVRFILSIAGRIYIHVYKYFA
jgi:hypothetical protein